MKIPGDATHPGCLPGLFVSLPVPLRALYLSGFSFTIPAETVVSHQTPVYLCWPFLRELLLPSTLASPYSLPPASTSCYLKISTPPHNHRSTKTQCLKEVVHSDSQRRLQK